MKNIDTFATKQRIMNAAISADIIASTSLTAEDKRSLHHAIESYFDDMESLLSGKCDVYCRIVKGDYIECYLSDPRYVLRAALMLKTKVKGLTIQAANSDKRIKLFRTYGARIAMGVGDMKLVDKEQGILDGDAIYLSGRKMDEQKTSNKDKIIVKNTLFFCSKDLELAQRCSVIAELLDFILNAATPKRCEIMYYRLLGKNETEVAEWLGVTQSNVNQHSTSTGWNAIDQAVRYFEQITF